MHCGLCGDQTSEVRPCRLDVDDKLAMTGDTWMCHACYKLWSPKCKYSNFITWAGHPCDHCGTQTSFAGPVSGMPEGVVCEQCQLPECAPGRGVWLCEECFERDHHGHKQQELIPLLDRLAHEFDQL